MKKAVFFAVALFGVVSAFSESGAQFLLPVDISRKNTMVSLTFAECFDTDVKATITRGGADYDVTGWDVNLILGGTTSGCVVEGVKTGYNAITFTVPASSMPTNGKYTVQITAMKDHRSEEWARGSLRVNCNTGMNYMPTCWIGYQKVAKLAASMITTELITNEIFTTILADLSSKVTVTIPASTNPCVRLMKSFVDDVPVKTKFVWDMTNGTTMAFRNATYPGAYFDIPTNRDFMASTFYLPGTNGVETFLPERIGKQPWFRSTSVTNRKFLVRGGCCTDSTRDGILF